MKQGLFLAMGLTLLAAASSEAQVSRVFVANSGNDGNDCLQPTTACRTLNAAIGKVDAQGEVIVTESGSYAGATITKGVKINVPAGVVAFSGLLIASNPGASGVVVVRGITLKSATPGSGTGVQVISGHLFLENSVIDGWATGLSVEAANAKIYVKNSTLRNNTTGLTVASGATLSQVAVEGSQFENNATGVNVLTGKVAVTRSVVAGNSVVGLSASGAAAEVTAQFCQVSHNGVGMRAQNSGVARLSDSSVTGNVTGVENVVATPGTFETFVTNQIRGNTSNTVGTLATVALQ